MARRVPPSSPEILALREKVAQRVLAALQNTFFEVEGTPMTGVKYEDGGFKTKPLDFNIEYMLIDAYVGLKGDIIFVFEPEDAQEYKTAEIMAKKIDAFMPLFAPAVAKALDIAGVEDIGDVLDVIGQRILDEEEVEAEKEKSVYKNDDAFGMF